MKNGLLLISLFSVLLASCKASVSSTPIGTDANPPVDSNGDQTTLEPTPSGPKSPYNYTLRAAKGTQASVFTYAEALATTDGKIALRFFTRSPIGMCNVSSLTDSSWYQPNFEYVVVVVGKDQLGSHQVVAKYGSRGDTFGTDQQISGSIFISKNAESQFEGWMSLFVDQLQIEGNFSVVDCERTHKQVEKLKLGNLPRTISLVERNTGRSLNVSISSNYSVGSTTYYGGYAYAPGTFYFDIFTPSGEFEQFSMSFYGLSAGQYLALGNAYSTKTNSGPGIGLIEGNILTINDQNLPHMTNHIDFIKKPKIKIEYLPSANKHRISIFWNGREYVGEQ